MNIEKLREGLTLMLEALDEGTEPTPQVSLPLEPAVDAESLKSKLAQAAETHGGPSIRNLVIAELGDFMPAHKMTDEQRAKIDAALGAL